MFLLPFSLNWVLLSQVADHETVECFGPAMVAIPKGTIAHLEAVAKLRPFLPGYGKRPKLFFFFFFPRAGKATEKMGSTSQGHGRPVVCQGPPISAISGP